MIIFLPKFSNCQSLWTQVDIGESSCSISIPFEPEWTFEFSEDSSYVWTGEAYEGDIYYGVICIEFRDYMTDAYDEDLIFMIESYLDFLQESFDIVSHTGYVKEFDMETNENAVGVSDSWTDKEGDPWEIRAWSDEFNLVVMFMYGSADLFTTDYKDFFFDSFRFPE